MSTSGSSAEGFTLLEFLVAFSILTLFLSAALTAVAVAIAGDRQASFLTRAAMIAQSKLAAAGADYPLRPGSTGGILPNGYAWRAEIRRYGNPGRSLPSEAFWVELTVVDTRGHSPRALTMTSLRLAPGAAQ